MKIKILLLVTCLMALTVTAQEASTTRSAKSFALHLVACADYQKLCALDTNIDFTVDNISTNGAFANETSLELAQTFYKRKIWHSTNEVEIQNIIKQLDHHT